MKAAANTRRERRFSVDVSATVSIEGRVVAARTRDLSRSGMCLISETRFSPEADLRVVLVLSLGPQRTSEPLALSGRAVWCTAMFGKYQVGVKFVEVDAERRRFLDLFMRFLDGEIKPAGAPGDEPDPPEPEEEEEPDKDDPFRP